MSVNSLPKTVTRQRRACDLKTGPSVPESSTLTTRLPSHVHESSNGGECSGCERIVAHSLYWPPFSLECDDVIVAAAENARRRNRETTRKILLLGIRRG